ncbi:unnamed protein product [Penicillium salamii]|nr:unnamed protein product [Penicillium salamii]CAG8361236.1 unnamed protein product [Penicillium salamii]
MACIIRGQRALPTQIQHLNRQVPILRYLSTSPQSGKPSPPTTVTVPPKTDLNAPISTLPIELITPPPVAASAGLADKLKRYVEFGRTYLTFYKTGLKNVYRNYRASLPLRSQLGLPAYIPISPPRNVSDSEPSSKSKYSQLGRGQFQLVRRSARDVRRMIPFTLILIVCGEFTPLIVPIFGSAITPATCRVPSQVEKERVGAAKRKIAALRSAGLPVSVDAEQMGVLGKFADPAWVAHADAAEVLRACAVFGLVKSHDKTGGSLLTGLIYRPRLVRYAQYLAIDDAMVRAGGVAAMNATEVRIAVEERGGVDVSGAFDRKQAENLERRWLEQWLAARKNVQQA